MRTGDTPTASMTSRTLQAALKAKGPNYRPRTRHLKADGTPKYINRLIYETSPYLLQHAHNPVNWYPWGDEAFARAKKEGKPILLSVGYATCHWCHVMERESFEDEAIARYLNENYIAMKVDREERPDIDDTYMQVVQMLTGRGGWPMTVLLTADKQPFFGGTYFPPQDKNNGLVKGFFSILKEMHAAYEENAEEVIARAQYISRRIAAAAKPSRVGEIPPGQILASAVRIMSKSFDSEWGGFGHTPKFPRPAMLELLLRYYRRTGTTSARDMVFLTLEKMAAGGMYDVIGGGFHRYSTDARWLTPHFEKMLYDNAQLVPLYLAAYQLSGREDFARIARETLTYVSREMTSPDGAFYSATDADSLTAEGHEEEGYFFTWTEAELHAVLGREDAALAAHCYGVTPEGNFEGRSIVHMAAPLETAAQALGLSEGVLRQRLDDIRGRLYAARLARAQPLRDDKILTAWNGLMVSAFAQGALVLGEKDYAARAEKAASFILRALRAENGTLWRSFREKHGKHSGYLDDYAFFIQGLLDVHEATSSRQWLEEALALQRIVDTHFWDAQNGGYFMTADFHEVLLARDKPLYDGAEPSGNSVALLNLLRLSTMTGTEDYQQRAERSFAAFAEALTRAPGALPKMLSALEYYFDTPLEIFIITPTQDMSADAFFKVFRGVFLPNRIFVATADGAALKDMATHIPALQDKQALHGRPTAFVCEKGNCQLPTSQPDVFASQLRRAPPPLTKPSVQAVPRSAH